MLAIVTRSLQLFTPQSNKGKSAVQADVAFLPAQVLTTLMYSSIKLDCAGVGQGDGPLDRVARDQA